MLLRAERNNMQALAVKAIIMAKILKLVTGFPALYEFPLIFP